MRGGWRRWRSYRDSDSWEVSELYINIYSDRFRCPIFQIPLTMPRLITDLYKTLDSYCNSHEDEELLAWMNAWG